jgi:hypothetical protein
MRAGILPTGSLGRFETAAANRVSQLYADETAPLHGIVRATAAYLAVQ